MSRRTANNMAEAPGQDSFLDVVANLVGIFLILIIIVGSQAKSAIDAARRSGAPSAAATAAPHADLQGKIGAAKAQSRELASDLEKLQQKIQDNQFQLAYRRKELEHSALLVQLTKSELDKEKSRLSQKERDSVAAQVELKALQEKQEELKAKLEMLANAKPDAEVVENLPSPKAQKSSVDEVHYRLKGGRLLHIPMDEIVHDAMRDMDRATGELRDRKEAMRSIGPIRGFKVHYRLYIEEKAAVAANGAPGVLRKIEADMHLEPVDEEGGETVDEAFATGSEMLRHLQEHPPGTSTVTLWVYPDSFGEFRKVRDALYKKGYLVAARPLVAGSPIGASTKGGRSVGQ